MSPFSTFPQTLPKFEKSQHVHSSSLLKLQMILFFLVAIPYEHVVYSFYSNLNRFARYFIHFLGENIVKSSQMENLNYLIQTYPKKLTC